MKSGFLVTLWIAAFASLPTLAWASEPVAPDDLLERSDRYEIDFSNPGAVAEPINTPVQFEPYWKYRVTERCIRTCQRSAPNLGGILSSFSAKDGRCDDIFLRAVFFSANVPIGEILFSGTSNCAIYEGRSFTYDGDISQLVMSTSPTRW